MNLFFGIGIITVAIARGKEKEKLARELGAHHYIDSSNEDVGQALKKLGGADAILATAASGKSMSPLLNGLKARGKLIVVGVSNEPTEFTSPQLIRGSKRIQGSASGTAMDSEDTLKFAHQHQIRSINEVVPLEQAQDAYNKMMKNQARFRMVLKIA
jgi:D-arabinose 1-dehydrogenase-like Zn-dependent alcohol dehydrogenase